MPLTSVIVERVALFRPRQPQEPDIAIPLGGDGRRKAGNIELGPWHWSLRARPLMAMLDICCL